MKTKTFTLSGLLFLLLSAMPAFAQRPEGYTFNTIVCNTPVDELFDHTIDYLQDNEYFIVSLDKASGFVQAKIQVKNRKLLSQKWAERRTLNFIIRPVTGKQAIVTLNIYSEELLSDDASATSVHYYMDKGISRDEAAYTPVLEGLKHYLADGE